jgi:pyrimidine-nucleoside phosphorylase
MGVAREIVEVKALITGYVSRIKTLEVGNAAMMLGAGRQKKEDEIDHSVGILIKVKVGEFINEGDTLAIIHSNGKNTVSATEKLRDCFEISNEFVSEKNIILDIVK